MIVDVLTLAILYTLRIVAGAAAIDAPLSFWILAFSIFLFLSLAFIKRDAELQSHDGEVQQLHGRGYITSDASLIQQLGVSSGYAAVLVLALYINSENVVMLYIMKKMLVVSIPYPTFHIRVWGVAKVIFFPGLFQTILIFSKIFWEFMI